MTGGAARAHAAGLARKHNRPSPLLPRESLRYDPRCIPHKRIYMATYAGRLCTGTRPAAARLVFCPLVSGSVLGLVAIVNLLRAPAGGSSVYRE